MPDIKSLDIASRELDELIATGDRIIAMAAQAENPIKGTDIADLLAWASGSGHIIRRLAGEGSQYEATFLRARADPTFSYVHGNNYDHLGEILGALKGLRRAMDAGLLVDLRRLIQANVFADFLEMAEHLLSEGYKDAAAVLIGGVLEDSLRKLSETKGLSVTNPKGRPLTIDPMNVNLAKADAYQSLTKKQITSRADLRNNAAHGNHMNYTAAEVKEMLLFVQRFCGEF